jgi:uncharacterized protein (DUF1697 family)
MAELVELFGSADCREVRSYIQSGNVVFEASPRVAARVAQRVGDAIRERFDFEAPIVLRSLEALDAVVRCNPYLPRGAPESALHVVFLADTPDAERVRELDPKRSPADSFAVHGCDIYLWLPNGVAQSKLTNDYFDSKLKTVSTGRNWRTVTALHAMMRG